MTRDRRPAAERAGDLRVAGGCDGWVRGGRPAFELATDDSSFFRNHSWGNQAGRGGPRLRRAAATARAAGVRQWVLFRMPDHGGFYFVGPERARGIGQGRASCSPTRSCRSSTSSTTSSSTTAGGGCAAALPTHRRRGRRPRLRVRATSAGCTARAAATSAGSTTASARACTVATTTSRARSGTSATRPTIVDADGNVVRVRARLGGELRPRSSCGDETGLAHFECVVIGGPGRPVVT